MGCKVCGREGCQIGWHQYASEPRGGGVLGQAIKVSKVSGDSKGGAGKQGDNGLRATDRTANRRSRKDYNAYQRDLMRKRRAAKRGKVLGDGGGPVEVESGPK